MSFNRSESEIDIQKILPDLRLETKSLMDNLRSAKVNQK